MSYSTCTLWMWVAFFSYWRFAARNVRKDRQSEACWSRWQHLGPVVLTFALLYLPVLALGPLGERFVSGTDGVGMTGCLITASGLLFAVWARRYLGQYWSGRVTIKEDHKLIRSGPYSFVRHPIYTGILLGILGSAIAVGEWRGLLALAVICLSYFRKISIEERTLRAHFGEQYEVYRREVKALIPYLA